MALRRKRGGLNRATPSQKIGYCGVPKHDGYGAMCFGCVFDFVKEEVAERERRRRAVRKSKSR